MGALVATLLTSCRAPPHAPAPDRTAQQQAAVAELARWEAAERASTDWRTAPPAQRALGADPVAALAVGELIVVVARGLEALLVLDASGAERARLAAVRAPRAIAACADGSLVIVGELAPELQRVRIDNGVLREVSRVRLAERFGFRDVACGADARGHRVHWVVDPIAGSVLTLNGAGEVLGELPVGPGALSVRAAGGLVAAASVEAHRVVVAPVDARGIPDAARATVLTNDGPFWSLDARVVDDEVLLAFGLIEDHPLDRTQGSFRFIDSFVRVEAVPIASRWSAHGAAAARRVLQRNTSELDVVMPKAVHLLDDDTLAVVGAGSGRLVELDISGPDAHDVAPRVVRAVPPGSVALALVAANAGAAPAALLANPLLDALVIVGPDEVRVLALPGGPPRRPLSRLGEALVFTTVMAPQQQSADGLSRFTCEACHFEGGGDGRVHSTGRGDVHATARPLFGLGNNVPLFTRALDADLVHMAHNEFRVANASTELDPWFTIDVDDAPWLRSLDVDGVLEPRTLRQALASFFLELRPATNPRVAGRVGGTFTEEERAGAALFAQRCASCHAPRLVGSDASTAVPLASWEALVLSEAGPLVWSRDGYEKTGIEPYVHDSGARPSSLRRVARKHPYFTNGTSLALEDVLARLRFDDVTFMHATSRTDLRGLDVLERRALHAFLLLL